MDELTTAQAHVRAAGEAAPGVMKAFGQLHAAALADGALSARTKEVMAVAVAVAVDCEGCVAWHVDAAKRAGATEAELDEALGVAVLFGGGPGAQRAGAARAVVAAAYAG